MDLSARILKLRNQLNLSQYKLAKLSGLSQAGLSEIESGKKQPTIETVNKICTALGITLAEFFADTQEQKPLSPEVRQVIDKVKKLPPDKLKVLNDVLDTWIEND